MINNDSFIDEFDTETKHEKLFTKLTYTLNNKEIFSPMLIFSHFHYYFILYSE